MTAISKEKGKTYIFSKGAPDYLLKNCKYFINAAGQTVEITAAFKTTLLGKLKEFADGTLRTLLLAYREGTDENNQTAVEDANKDLIIFGMVGIKDPLREAVPGAVKKCF